MWQKEIVDENSGGSNKTAQHKNDPFWWVSVENKCLSCHVSCQWVKSADQ